MVILSICAKYEYNAQIIYLLYIGRIWIDQFYLHYSYSSMRYEKLISFRTRLISLKIIRSSCQDQFDSQTKLIQGVVFNAYLNYSSLTYTTNDLNAILLCMDVKCYSFFRFPICSGSILPMRVFLNC